MFFLEPVEIRYYLFFPFFAEVPKRLKFVTLCNASNQENQVPFTPTSAPITILSLSQGNATIHQQFF